MGGAEFLLASQAGVGGLHGVAPPVLTGVADILFLYLGLDVLRREFFIVEFEGGLETVFHL